MLTAVSLTMPGRQTQVLLTPCIVGIVMTHDLACGCWALYAVHNAGHLHLMGTEVCIVDGHEINM